MSNKNRVSGVCGECERSLPLVAKGLCSACYQRGRALKRNLPEQKPATGDPEWRARAACLGVDPEMFFRNSNDAWTPQNAQKVCVRCPVSGDCLDWAIRNAEGHGVWGGLVYKDRLRVQKERGIVHSRKWNKAIVKPCGTLAARRRHQRNNEECAVCAEPIGQGRDYGMDGTA